MKGGILLWEERQSIQHSRKFRHARIIFQERNLQSKSQENLACLKGGESVREWAVKYRVYGDLAFEQMHTNKSYSKEFKEMVVKEYFSGRESYSSLAIKYNIPSYCTINGWVSRYNNHIELKDYDPKREVYMAERRKTTLEERLEIIRYCLDHDRDIKNTASLYKCSYAQVYSCVQKDEKNGEQALIDKRGIRKKEEELTDLEKAQRQIAKLEKEKE